MTQILAYLAFNGNCREAMSFYKECLGGELQLQTIAESPMAAQMPAEMGQLILHSNLTNGGMTLMATDMNAPNVTQGNSVALCINCSSEEELHTFFSKLSEGGKIVHPVEKFFAGTMGNATDKFGMQWMFYYGENMQQ